MKSQRLFQVILLLAAVDSVAYGLWACVWPDDLFTRLQSAEYKAIEWKFAGVQLNTQDHILLWRCLGIFFLAHAVIVALVAWRPRAWGSLVVTPLIGRMLPLGMWLWLLGTNRVELEPMSLRILALHDGVWIMLFLAFLVAWGCARVASSRQALLQ